MGPTAAFNGSAVIAELRTLHNFPANSYPQSTLVFGNDGALYGTTQWGGDYGRGLVFRITTEGQFTNLYSFHSTEGTCPFSGLLKGEADSFYGTAQNGGASGYGSVFRITTNGAFATLCSFANTNGAYPLGVLIRGPEGALYGTTFGGGSLGHGTIFKVTTNGVLTSLVSFANTNGAGPFGGLFLGHDGAFYGSTTYGGDLSFGNGYGTVYRFIPGTQLDCIHIFHGYGSAHPLGELLQTSDGLLYGVAGSIFQLSTNGSYKVLDDNIAFPQPSPRSGLMRGFDGALYGSADDSVYRITTNGVVIELAVFYNSWNGSDLRAGVVQGPDNVLYGTTAQGGLFGGGIVFRIDLTTLLYPLTHETNGWRLSFAALPGNTYRVLRSSSPAGPWTDVANVVAGDYGEGNWTDPVQNLESAFYLLAYP